MTLNELMLPFPVEWSGQRLQFGVGGAATRSNARLRPSEAGAVRHAPTQESGEWNSPGH